MDEKLLRFLQAYLEQMPSFYTEKQRRLCSATIAMTLGWKGKTFVHNVTGMSYQSIRLGIEELKYLEEVVHTDETTTYEMLEEIDRINNPHRSRRAGGGRKLATEVYPTLKEHIDHIVYECSYGDPMSSHMWTNATLDFVHEVLIHDWNIDVSRPTISKIIKELGYSLQGNKKMEQVGKSHPDRDKQFKFINALSGSFIDKGYPVVSGDTKKKEYIQNTANRGREYRKKGDPRPVMDHVFMLLMGPE